MKTICLLSLLLLVGCSTTDGGLTATEDFALSAVSGQEEDSPSSPGDFGGEEEGGRPALFRVCASREDWRDRFDAADLDQDGDLSESEGDAAIGGPAGRGRDGFRRAVRWTLLRSIYDLDMDGALSDSEREDLFADADSRCQALHERLVAEFDTDGDGVLSDAERVIAEQAVDERREEGAPPLEGEERVEDMCDRPGGGGDMGGPRPPHGQRPDLGEVTDALEDRLTAAWDVDGDGSLSLEEHTAMYEALSARFAAGEPMRPREGG